MQTLSRTAWGIASPVVRPTPSRVAMKVPLAGQIGFRQMAEADADAVVDLLARGFPARTRGYWVHAIDVLRHRPVPDGLPRYGYVLTADAAVVGVILTIFSTPDDGPLPRCNLSSWYVEPDYRGFGSLLITMAKKKHAAIYVNLSPVAQTILSIVMQGFSCYAHGVFLAAGALARSKGGVRIEAVAALPDAGDLSARILSDHAAYGCLSLVCSFEGRRYPFIFLKRRIPRTIIPCAQLVYCEDVADLVRFAGPLGRYLLRRGMPLMMLDANGRIDGLPGVYLAGRTPKYFSGDRAPRLGDLAYSEAVLFGP